MSEQKYKAGQIVWADLTTNQADSLKEFYKDVIGWQEYPVAVKDGEESYNDYAMLYDEKNPAGGICNQRGINASIPPQWIMYVCVDDVASTLEKAISRGGKLVHENKKADGTYNYVIIQDPAGAVFGFGKFQ